MRSLKLDPFCNLDTLRSYTGDGGPKATGATEVWVQTPVRRLELSPAGIYLSEGDGGMGARGRSRYNANKTMPSTLLFCTHQKQKKQKKNAEGLASVGGVGCLTRANAVYESRVFASNHNVYSHGPASFSCFPSD